MPKMIPSSDGHPDAVLVSKTGSRATLARFRSLISRARYKGKMHFSTGALGLMFRTTRCGELNTLNSSQFYCKQCKNHFFHSATVEILYSTICADSSNLS